MQDTQPRGEDRRQPRPPTRLLSLKIKLTDLVADGLLFYRTHHGNWQLSLTAAWFEMQLFWSTSRWRVEGVHRPKIRANYNTFGLSCCHRIALGGAVDSITIADVLLFVSLLIASWR